MIPAPNRIAATYRTSLALLTDLYQLTMAFGYFKCQTHDLRSVFYQYFRRNPSDGGFSVACGLADVLDFLHEFRFAPTDIDFLATLTGDDDRPLFEPAFLAYLAALEFTCDIDAIPEGSVVFPNEPLIRITGPLLQAQLLETILLNIVNFQTLIATKAARVCHAAGDDAVLEFGLRRAQGLDGALAASRAAYVGGCAATSNVLAGKLFGIPIKGTHAHSWVMSFDSEPHAFQAYADAMPNNCVFLVDTYNTLQGVRHAAQVGQRLRESGHKLLGIRLDSGDLAYLSIEARKILDAAGLHDAFIVASNDLDENLIQSLKDQGAKITVWGVGTNLVTGGSPSALTGVYKLSALQSAGGQWQYKIKASETTAKSTIPGILQVRRYRQDGRVIGDAIFDELKSIGPAPALVDPADVARRKSIPRDAAFEDLLIPVMRHGRAVYRSPDLATIRERTKSQMACLHPGVKRFTNPHTYPVGLEPALWELRTQMLLDVRTPTP